MNEVDLALNHKSCRLLLWIYAGFFLKKEETINLPELFFIYFLYMYVFTVHHFRKVIISLFVMPLEFIVESHAQCNSDSPAKVIVKLFLHQVES